MAFCVFPKFTRYDVKAWTAQLCSKRHQHPRSQCFIQLRRKSDLCVEASNPGGPRGPCVGVAWLQRNLEIVRIYDARGCISETFDTTDSSTCSANYDAYLEGHIPGAVFVNWLSDGAAWQNRDDTGPSGGGDGGGSSNDGRGGSASGEHGFRTRTLAVVVDPDVYVPCFEARGLSTDRPVVVYDVGTGMIAARVWWQLLLYGHPRPYVLAGGWPSWLAEGGRSELYEPCPLKLSSVYDEEPQLHHRASPKEFRLAATRAEGEGEFIAHTVAVLLVPESFSSVLESRGITSSRCPDGLPLARCLSFRSLIRACLANKTDGGSSYSSCTGINSDRDPGGVATWTSVVLGVERDALAHFLGEALGGIPVGPCSHVRLLLASPHDAALSACAVGALLYAAGHEHWAVCEAW
ncbi:hypothetical protein VaNZ11_002908 [Volvox africanus]|uniref:Rhodanese domain-containing protein n=1 Tax=Volvox africanus TaxID=51714 RepID=A0ABQ5RU29_9CHLO|nr:hypothetical protein VaNZ11_002908 [Volvox africanus]